VTFDKLANKFKKAVLPAPVAPRIKIL